VAASVALPDGPTTGSSVAQELMVGTCEAASVYTMQH
jgi:hypothetical protein